MDPRALRNALVIALLVVLGGCGGSPDRGSSAVEPVPRQEPRSKYGNPSSYVVFGKRYYVRSSAAGYRERGIASWYGPKFHGKRTSSGETYDMHALTAAHKSLPLPTYVRVTNLENGRSLVLRVNDRGPFVKNRLIDLSYEAAQRLGIVAAGTGLVEVEALVPGRAVEPRARTVALPQPGEVADTGIFIQLGAFQEQVNARSLQERLIAAGEFDVHIAEIERAEGMAGAIYRVRMGPLPTVADADRAYLRLEELGYYDHRIVID